MIRFENVSWSAGEFRFQSLNFDVPKGDYSVLMGRTGCGKTTIIELICGLRRPKSGDIWIGSRRVTHLSPAQRKIGYVPQDGALFPSMTVREQLGFAPRVAGRPSHEIKRQVESLAERLGLTALLERRPHGLSGGERQRVALGRALARQPLALLLDEPLSALDEETRDDMATLLKETQRQFELTALHVTHHRQEARRLADHIFVMNAGRIARAPSEETAPSP